MVGSIASGDFEQFL